MQPRRTLIGACLIAVLLTPAPGNTETQATLSYSQIVGFGDSLSDPGNRFFVTGEQSLPPFEAIPGPPYAIGGHHYSNGSTWLEQLALLINDPMSGNPGYKLNRRFSNYAFGGARARDTESQADLMEQVLFYLGENGGNADPNALYVIWVGANDAFDALRAYPGGADILPSAVGAVIESILTLHAAGAEHFLIPNLPNLAITPAAQGNAALLAYLLSGGFNTALDDTLSSIEPFYDFTIHRLDIWSLLNSVHAAPAAFGLENVLAPCLAFGVTESVVCATPETYLFWDAIHPTTVTHGILADFAYGLLTSP